MGVVLNQSIKNSFSFYVGMAIGALNTIFIYPNVFSEYPEHFGLIQIIIAYAILVSTFSSLGIPKIFIRFFPAIKAKGELYFLSLTTTLFGFLLISIIYYFFKDYILSFIQASDLLKDNFYYIIVLVLLISFYDLLTAISRSFLNAATPVFINEVFLKLYSLSILLLHWYNFIDFSTFLKVYISGYFFKFLILLIIQLYHSRIKWTVSFKNLNVKNIISYGLYVLLGSASVIIVSRLDMIMIGTLIDLENVAFYTVAFYIGNAIRVPGKAIVSISIPILSKAWEEKDFTTIQKLYYKSSINQLIIGGVFFLCVWINIQDIISLLPEKFQGGKLVILYIGLAQLFNISSGVNGAILVNSKYYRYDLYSNIILVIITFFTNYLLIPSSSPLANLGIVGINGAAFATAISVFIFNITRLLVIKVKMNMHPFSIKTIYTLIVLVFVYYVSLFLPSIENTYLDMIWKTFFVFLTFTPLVLFFNLSEDITKLFYNLKKII